MMKLLKTFVMVLTLLLMSYVHAIANNLQVQVTKQSDWSSGFCSNVSVSNPNNSREQWSISFDAEGLITNLWNANYSQNQTTLETTASGVGWNDFVEPHSSISFGYCANKVVEPTPPPAPPSDGDLVVTQTDNANWDGGFCKNVQVKNTTDHKIDWEVTFPINGTVTNSWSSNFSQNAETLEATASGVDWNNIIQPNEQAEFGYCANDVEQVPDPDQVALDADKSALTFKTIKVDNSAKNNIKTVLTLPTSGAEGSTIIWSSDSGAIATDGQVTRPAIGEPNQIVHLTATLTKGSLSSTKSFTLTVIASEMSDSDIVANDIVNLTFDSIKSNNSIESEITSNLNLINSGENESQISWASSQIGTIAINGSVIRPAFGESDVSVTLTATVTKGSVSDSKTFSLIVLAKEETIIPDSQYAEVLPLALKFYEAQRATGPFPTVSWRKAGGLSDGADVGRDLTGGWFDAGDHVKFNLPMSYSATMLNWGMIAFPNGYNKTGKLAYGKEQVKYALDYFIQAYNEGANPDSASDDKVYYQVGDAGADHGFWGPPELMTMERPTFTCDAQNRCSEVAGGMAAAMASGAILFQDDATYSATLLDKAKKIYRYAEEYQGNNGYTAANGFYSSYSGYNDELAWGAVWLYRATGDTAYLNKAKTYVASASDAMYWSQSWDNVSNGVNLLLAEITGEATYTNAIETHLNHWKNGVSRTTGGLAFLDKWGSLRYSSTASFMALLYAKGLDDGQQKTDYITFAKGQMDYILGDNPRNSSYVVGYGTNPPINPHHRASHNSQTNNINLPINNEFVLEGALVGGPKSANDFDYADDRSDYVANEVATDYNAGFTGALAGMIELADSNSTTPPPTTSTLFSEFNLGFGGSYSFPFSSNTAGEKIWVSSVDLVMDDNIENNSYYAEIKNFDATAFDNLQDNLKNSKFLVYWLVEGWEESWFNPTKIQQAMDAGYIPVFNYWWFGDKLMNGMPDATKKAEYATDNAKVAEFLNKLNGTKMLIMEPEFNKENVLSSEVNQHEFATIIGDAIDSIKADTTDVLFSLAMTDTGNRGVNQTYAKCGYDNCALGDKYEWGRPEIVYNDLSDKLDFISFQEMIGQFSRDPMNAGGWDSPNPIAYSDADIGIDELPNRIANFSQFLQEKYNKPVFLPYIAIATATWSDANSNSAIEDLELNYSGWETKADSTYQALSTMKQELQDKGLFGFAPMALFDNPRHDYGGYQYFMNNEYHLGIVKSGAVDEIDSATNGDIEPKSGIVGTLFGL